MKPQTTMKLVGGVFGIVGAITLCAGIISAGKTVRFLSAASKTQGEIVKNLLSYSSRGAPQYTPEYRFQTADGRAIDVIGSTASNPPAYRTGQTVEIIYDPAQPQAAKINAFLDVWMLTVVLLVFGIAFGGFGIVGAYLPYRQAKHRAWLRQHGQKISTQFERVAINGGLQVNGQSPWQVLSQWQDPATKAIRIFKSENLWFDPSAFLKSNQSIYVYLDPNHHNAYAMDIDFLPKEA